MNATFTEGENKDTDISFVPAFTGRGEALVHFPIGMTVGSDVSYTGTTEFWYKDSWGSVTEAVSSYSLIGLSVMFSPVSLDGKLAIMVRMNNLLDTQYAGLLASNSMTTPYSVAYYPAAGRAITVSASYRY